MIPIVFWESLLPWLKDMLPADTSCSSRNALSTRRGSARRNSHDSPTVSTKATVSPRSGRSEEHTSELQSRLHLVCRLLLEKKKKTSAQTAQRCLHTRR